MRHLALISAMLPLCLAQALHAESLTQADAEQATPSWSTLKFAANKFGFTATAELHRETLDSADARAQLVPTTEQTALQPRHDKVTRLTLTSQYAGQTIAFTSWVEPPSGRVLQSIRTRHTFTKDEEKVYRFTSDGMLQIKRRDGKELFERIQLADYQPYVAHLSQPIYLFYLVSSSSKLNDINDTARLPIYANSSVYLLDLKVSETLQMPTRYSRGTHSQQAVDRYVSALRIDVMAQPLGPTDDSEPINIAGIEKGITLYIERETRIPLELRGERALFGELRYKLQSMAP